MHVLNKIKKKKRYIFINQHFVYVTKKMNIMLVLKSYYVNCQIFLLKYIKFEMYNLIKLI